jgi:ribose/xylose/arabinose/galactoside ABC-type transport system permease subunit
MNPETLIGLYHGAAFAAGLLAFAAVIVTVGEGTPEPEYGPSKRGRAAFAFAVALAAIVVCGAFIGAANGVR